MRPASGLPPDPSSNGRAAMSERLLTQQQRRALRLYAVGCADKEIAWRLGISERTVRFHISEAKKRLNGAHARAQSR